MNLKTRIKTLLFGLCAGLLLGTASSALAQITVSFQVNMAVAVTNGQFIPAPGGTDYVEARGSFEGWNAGFVLTNNPNAANPWLFSGTTNVTDALGTLEQYKFAVDGGTGPLAYESPVTTGGNNRTFTLGTTPVITVNAGVTNEALPAVYFSDISTANTTNNVTFQVDMSVQVKDGNFKAPPAGSDYVEARGSSIILGGWNGGFQLTNNPNASNTNLYTGTTPCAGAPGFPTYYKFCVDGGSGVLGWENPISTAGGNRQYTFSTATTPQVLPPVYWADFGPGSSLTENTIVTFSVNMTNAVGTDLYPFTPGTDYVFINGVTTADSSGFWSWASSQGLYSLGGPGEFLMTNNPVGSEIYSLQLTIPAGTALAVDYKYSINGVDDEAGFQDNHIRYIRADGSYVMPLDTFGNQLVESAFGNLKAGQPSAGNIPITWLGLPNVHLQTSSNLAGPWTDHPETAGLSSTNWPVGSGNLFFRLVQPGS
jgi:hypothetical protein